MNLRPLYYLPIVMRNQYLKLENLRKWQEKRLRLLVSHAYRNTRFYHEKFKKAHITPSDIQTLDDLKKIPIVTKEEIRASPKDVIAAGYDERTCEVHHTAGSSGAMLEVLYDRENQSYEEALTYRYHMGMGMRPWHRYFMICHDPVEMEQHKEFSPFRRMFSCPGDLPEEEKVLLAQKYDPHIIGGHPSMLYTMAKIMEEKGIKITPKLAIIGGEVALPFYREYIEKVFHCPTFNKYGAYEAKSIAWECRDHRMHIDADSVIVEFLKDGEPASPGERGEVVTTNLWNMAMPFIRYRLNDIGIPSDEVCTCGRTFPVMKVIEGKSNDFLVLPSGRIMPPASVVPHFWVMPQIKRFKIVQKRKDLLEIKIVPTGVFTKEMEEDIVRMMKEVLGEPVTIDIEKVESIPQSGRGKYRVIVSDVELDLSQSRS